MVFMARTVITTDDLDGSTDAETLKFSFDGVSYTIDLAKKNRTAFEKALKPYIDVATKSAGRKATTRPATRRGRTTRRRSSSPDLTTIRAWAKDNGVEVSERGRIAQSVIDAYNAAR